MTDDEIDEENAKYVDSSDLSLKSRVTGCRLCAEQASWLAGRLDAAGVVVSGLGCLGTTYDCCEERDGGGFRGGVVVMTSCSQLHSLAQTCKLRYELEQGQGQHSNAMEL